MNKLVRTCISFNGNTVLNLNFNGFTFQHLKSIHLFSTSSTHKNTPIKNPNSSSLLVNYLINSLGFSKPQSLSTCSLLSKRRKLISKSKLSDTLLIQNAKSVVNFFTQLGFQQNHVMKLITYEPRILVSRVDSTLKPKINLLFDLGLSQSDLILVVSRCPTLLHHNLGGTISSLRVVLGCDDNVICVLKRLTGYYLTNVTRCLLPNVEFLQNCYGIPRDNVRRFFIRQPRIFVSNACVFREKLVRVEERFGIPRDSPMFLYGFHLVCYSVKCIEGKFEMFRSFGWVHSDVIALLRRNPMCFTTSEGSIRERLEFLMKQLGYEPSYLALHPTLFTYSVKKRLLPRHRVLEVLKEKGLIRGDYSLASVVCRSEPEFLRKFVLPFEEVRQVYAQLTGSKL